MSCSWPETTGPGLLSTRSPHFSSPPRDQRLSEHRPGWQVWGFHLQMEVWCPTHVCLQLSGDSLTLLENAVPLAPLSVCRSSSCSTSLSACGVTECPWSHPESSAVVHLCVLSSWNRDPRKLGDSLSSGWKCKVQARAASHPKSPRHLGAEPALESSFPAPGPRSFPLSEAPAPLSLGPE